MLARLASLRPADYGFNFKAAAAALWSGSAGRLPCQFAARAASTCPAYWAGHCVHAQLLAKSGRWAEAVQIIKEQIIDGMRNTFFRYDRATPRGDWEHDLVYSAIRIIPEAQKHLRSGDGGNRLAAEASAFKARFEAAFPRAATTTAGGGGSNAAGHGGRRGGGGGEAAETVQAGFVRGLGLLGNPSKTAADWAEARRLCERAAAAGPAVYWYQLSAGICCTFAPKAGAAGAVAGKYYADAAVAIASTEPNVGPPLAHALLARCLVNSGGGGSVGGGGGGAGADRAGENDAIYAAAAAVVAYPGLAAAEHADGSEHAWLLLDTVRVVRQWCSKRSKGGGGAALLAAYTADFSLAFPGLEAAATKVAQEADGCIVS